MNQIRVTSKRGKEASDRRREQEDVGAGANDRLMKFFFLSW